MYLKGVTLTNTNKIIVFNVLSKTVAQAGEPGNNAL